MSTRQEEKERRRAERLAREADAESAAHDYGLSVVWRRPRGAGTTTWNYSGSVKELRDALLTLAADLEAHPDYWPEEALR
jgi:hypothetical protein